MQLIRRSFLKHLSSSYRSDPHHHRHQHLVITRLMPAAVNALLISIIVYQFGTVYCSDEGGVGVGTTATRNATSLSAGSSSSATNNETSYHYQQHRHEDDNDTGGINLSGHQKPHQANPWKSNTRRAPAECTQDPKFSLLTSESLLKSANVSYNEKKAEIWTFGRFYLILECSASSPIDFNFEGHLINKLRSVETTRRTFEDPRMPSCYSISITVETNRESTGNYTCWNLQHPELNTSLYMFAHGGTPPYLLHADIGIEVIEVETDIHDRVVTIPCVVTNPNISVALYKIKPEEFQLVQVGEYLSYDPKRGFIMQVRKYPEPYGKYKCVAMNSSHYDVIVHVKQPTDNFFHEPIVQGRLEIIQDRIASQSFICNSSSQSPSIVTTADCTTPIECRLAQKCLSKSPYCSSPCRCSFRGDKCSKTLESNYEQIGFPVDVGCSTIAANKNGGAVECSAVNFEPSARVMYFVGLNGRIIQNWKSVPQEELVQVETTEEMPNNVVFFVGEKLELRCIASKFIFSRGFHWKFQLTNGTLIKADVSSNRSQLQEEAWFISEEVEVQILRPDITTVLCYAPVWNETGWVHNSMELVIKDSVAPKFLDPANTTISFFTTTGNNSIVCEVEGFPTPGITWFKNGEEYINNLQLDNTIANLTRAYVSFPDLSLFDDQSVFICNATNPRGTVMKAFKLNVREASLRLTMTLAGAGFILLIGIFGILLWIFYTSSRRRKPGKLYAFTDQDIDMFFKGNPEAMKKCGDGVAKAYYHPYDDRFEVNADDLLLDYDEPLGWGQFGVVLRGKLQTKQGAFPVAVKTTKENDTNQLRSLLSEIKLITYIGEHENIVKLIGAITKDLKKLEVFVVVEYCQLGNLEAYLRDHRGTFFDEFRGQSVAQNGNVKAAVPYVQLDCLVKTSDLIFWAYQIANALEYLASIKVVHGDVALRNMLLDANHNVKITDFGLSKHIYTRTDIYKSKTKTQENPLPWRWLAPETLKENIFSMAGDVWSYGILLYELFSLAELPYKSFNNLSDEFITLIENGYRLDKPAYCNDEIYTTMRDCWRLKSPERPRFTTLKHFFLQFIRMQHPPNQSEIVQRMEYFQQRKRSQSIDTDSSDLDKEDNTTLTTFVPTANSCSTFGSVNSIISGPSGMHGRPRGIVG